MAVLMSYPDQVSQNNQYQPSLYLLRKGIRSSFVPHVLGARASVFRSRALGSLPRVIRSSSRLPLPNPWTYRSVIKKKIIFVDLGDREAVRMTDEVVGSLPTRGSEPSRGGLNLN